MVILASNVIIIPVSLPMMIGPRMTAHHRNTVILDYPCSIVKPFMPDIGGLGRKVWSRPELAPKDKRAL